MAILQSTTVNGILNITSLTGSQNDLVIISTTGSISRTSSTAFIVSGSTNSFNQNGNIFGATAVLGTIDNQRLLFKTNNIDRLWIKETGEVGIGAMPSYAKLDIVKTTLGTNSLLAFHIFDGIYNPRVVVSHITSTSSHILQFDSSYSTGTGYANYTFLNGNVGIGTSLPNYKLHIVGSESSPLINITNTQHGLKVSAAGIAPYNHNIAEFYYIGNGNSLYIKAIQGTPGVESQAALNLKSGGTQSTIIYNSDTVEIIRFNYNRNISIGTTSNIYRLDVVSGATISARFDGRVIGVTAVNSDEFMTLGQLTWSNITSKPTTLAGYGIADFVSSNSSTSVDPNTVTTNGHYYALGNISPLLGQTDGALYVQGHSTSWSHQIYGDYRTGHIAVRGKNNGTWGSWSVVFSNNGNIFGGTATLGTNDNYPVVIKYNNTTSITIATNGKVGVGAANTSPIYTLDVSGGVVGAANFTVPSYNTSLVNNYLMLYGGNGGGILADSTGNISFGNFVSSTLNTTMYLDNTGKLGIGTTSPSTSLYINKSVAGDNLIVTNVQSSANNWVGLSIRYLNAEYFSLKGNVNTGELRVGGINPSGYYTTIYSNGNETMRISSGKVSIGGINPSYHLHVVSGAAISGSFDGRVIGVDAVNSNEFTTLGQLPNYGNVTNRNTFLITDWNQTTYQNTHFLSSESSATNAPTTDYTYGMQLSFHRSGAAYRTQLVSSLYGTNELWVRNSKDSDVWSSWTRIVTNSGTWNIGITGFANGVTFSNITSRPTTLAGYGITDAFTQNGNSFGATAIIGTNDNQDIVFKTNGVTSMTLAKNGRLGIGTTTPAYTLHIFSTSSNITLYTQNYKTSGDSYAGYFQNSLNTGTGNSYGIYVLNSSSAANNYGIYTTNEGMNYLSGNVGIGITPAFKLHVCESGGSYVAQFEGSSTSVINIGKASLSGGSYIKFMNTSCESWVGLDGSGDTAPGSFNIYTNGSNPIIFKAGVTEKMRILSSGNVGIGTSSPIYKLEVLGNVGISTNLLLTSMTGTQSDLVIISTTGSIGRTSSASFLSNNYFAQNGNSFGATATLGTNDNYGLEFKALNTPRMMIATSGNVAFSPKHTLYTDSNTGVYINSGNGGVNGAAVKILYANSTNILGEMAFLANRNGVWSSLYINGSGSSLGNSIYIEGNKPIIFNAGTVSIGTNTVINQTKFHVRGSGTGTSSYIAQFHNSSGNSNALVIQDNGYIGIGHSTPLSFLDVRASVNSSITPLSSVPNTATTMIIGNIGTNGVLTMGHDNAGKAWLQARSVLASQPAEDILLNPLGGNVGIGTTSPLYTLDVVSADSIASKFNGRIIGVTAINSNELTTLGQIRYVVVEKSDNVLYTDVTNVSQTYNLMLSSISSGTTHSNVFHANSITYNPFTGVLTVPSISATSYLGLTGGGGGSTNSFNQNGNTFGVTASIGTIDNKALNFITNNTVKMTIDTTGFIGIGNTNPSYSLDIRGNLRVGGLTASDNFIKIGAGRSSNGYAYIDLVGDTTYNGISAAAGFRIIRSNNGANAATDLQHAGTGNFNITNNHAADMIFKINNTEKVKINSTGITIQSDDSFQSTGTLNIKTNANNPIVMKINGTETTRFDENGILVTSTTPPSTNPASGTMYIYLDANGYLKAKGSNGTITTLATP